MSSKGWCDICKALATQACVWPEFDCWNLWWNGKARSWMLFSDLYIHDIAHICPDFSYMIIGNTFKSQKWVFRRGSDCLESWNECRTLVGQDSSKLRRYKFKKAVDSGLEHAWVQSVVHNIHRDLPSKNFSRQFKDIMKKFSVLIWS